MAKKCIVCDEKALYKIKDTNDYYCEDCSHEYFDDVKALERIEREANSIKGAIEKKFGSYEGDEDDDDLDSSKKKKKVELAPDEIDCGLDCDDEE